MSSICLRLRPTGFCSNVRPKSITSWHASTSASLSSTEIAAPLIFFLFLGPARVPLVLLVRAQHLPRALTHTNTHNTLTHSRDLDAAASRALSLLQGFSFVGTSRTPRASADFSSHRDPRRAMRPLIVSFSVARISERLFWNSRKSQDMRTFPPFSFFPFLRFCDGIKRLPVLIRLCHTLLCQLKIVRYFFFLLFLFFF